jgi:hypothetical protein
MVTASPLEVAMRIHNSVFWLIPAMALAAASQLAAGPVNYWQQDVAYEIDVTLDPNDHSVAGHERLTYTNNSPHTLTFAWFHLYPNAYKDGNSLLARDAEVMGSAGVDFLKPEDRGFIEIRSISVDGRQAAHSFKPGDETEMRVGLPEPLPPGGSVVFDIDFYVRIPRQSGILAQRMLRKQDHYEVTQWYPRVVVYDATGWHPDGYRMLGEFYGEFGTFDVRITLPENMTVAATGNLVGPQSETVRLDSLAEVGAQLDSLRAIEAKGEIKRIHKATRQGDLAETTKTLHYRAENVHDFAWVADKDFILKRGRYRDVTINVYVTPKYEKEGAEAVGYTHDALEHYGRHYGEYPFAQMSVVDGCFGGGMEYPNLTIVGFDGAFFLRWLEMVVMHETGHNWFQGMLGSNEMAEVWLDEGINTFAENRYLEEKYGKEGNMTEWPWWLGFMPDWNDDYYHSFLYYLAAANGRERSLLTPGPEIGDEVVWVAQMYGKGARVTDMLRYCLGDEVFDETMQTYFKEYRFHHPTTEDFKEVAERTSGQDLDWFFDQWMKTTEQCDLAIAGVERQQTSNQTGGPGQITVKVAQRGGCRMPADLRVGLRDGTEIEEHWGGTGSDTSFTINVADWPSYVWVDPDDRILEVDNWNNRSPRKVSFHPIGTMPSFDSYQVFYGPSLWYDDDVDGWRPGLWLNGGQCRDRSPLRGRYQWTVGASYGTRSDKINYRVALGHPLRFPGGSPFFSALVKDLEGRVGGYAGLRWRWGACVARGPETRLEAGAYFQNVYNTAYLERTDWSSGRSVGGRLRLAYAGNQPRFRTEYDLDIKGAHDALGGVFNFLRTSLTAKVNCRWTRWLRTSLRLFGGYVDGDPPLQERLYLSGGLVPEGLLAFVADGRGDMAPQNNYYVPGDANLRGYYGRHAADKVAASLSLGIPLPKIPVTLFYDLGNVWPDFDEVSLESLKQDAGIAIGLGPVSGHFPIWISDPLPGEDELKYRWLITTNLHLAF